MTKEKIAYKWLLVFYLRALFKPTRYNTEDSFESLKDMDIDRLERIIKSLNPKYKTHYARVLGSVTSNYINVFGEAYHNSVDAATKAIDMLADLLGIESYDDEDMFI